MMPRSILYPALALLAGALLAIAGQARAAENIVGDRSTAAESNHVFCNATGSATVRKAPCVLRSIYITTGAVAGYLMVFDATAAPVDGAVTPRECVYVPATSTIGIDFGLTADPYVTGITAVFSSTGCFTKTASATAFFKGRAQ